MKVSDKWSFYKMPNRRELTSADVRYWKRMLTRILKIGAEFEFNLPEKKNGTCKGDSNTCPCSNLSMDSLCWKMCSNRIGCCENKTDTCSAPDCAGCEHFSGACSDIFCPTFVSACFSCSKYITECHACEYLYDPKRNPDAIRECLNETLKPNNTYGQVNCSGVHSIKKDGSLLGQKGAEIITIGRRVDYWEFYKMVRNIMDNAMTHGAYMNERCSIHMHALASYYGKVIPNQEKNSVPNRVNEMEKEMPETILANLHQLVRRYQNAMTWMMMGLNEPDRMTRWEKFRVSVLPVSAVMFHMRDVCEQVSRNSGGNKYGWVNYNQVGFSDNGDIDRFHVEFRACDGLLSPSAVAALACMYYALIIKAVEISRYGVVEAGDIEWMDQAGKIKEALLNNTKGYQDGDRFGDTSHLHKYQNILIDESLDLVRQLKSILIKVGPAYEVLEKLAERPCALRRCDGDSWRKIEEDLKVIVSKEDALIIRLEEVITLNQVTECSDEEEWISTVGRFLNERGGPVNNYAGVEESIRSYVIGKKEDGELVWSNKIGAPILI